MAGDDLTQQERRFVERCAQVNAPLDLVEYHLDLADFDLNNPDGQLYGSRRSIYTLAWERIKAEMARNTRR